MHAFVLLTALAATSADAGVVEKLVERVRPSIVVLRVDGRSAKGQALGTGFVISADGLIVTNQHVIDEGRLIQVELADGKTLDVLAVHALDRRLDLAVLRVDLKGTKLKPLELAKPDSLKDGQSIIVVGNPKGLKHSVVAGVVSARREIEGRSMIQLAIPVEPGNSGGPVLDLEGRVHGVVTLKSLVTPNLGFAVPIAALKPLLDKPNPILMKAWLTIGALDEEDWQTIGGSRWRQRAGRILVTGVGEGFGGRSLCLSRRAVPAQPYEVAVAVKLDDESGAAGLAFNADGGDKHYGFYPTGGRLRLTHFEGPDVFSWKILRDEPSPHYRPGDWNVLKVRIEKDRLRCFVNDHLVFDVEEQVPAAGQAGLCKFRTTTAEFRQFRLGKDLADQAPSAATKTRIAAARDGLAAGQPSKRVAAALTPDGPAGPRLLRDEAERLERQAADLRQLAQVVHQRSVIAELQKALTGKEESIDLIHAALLIARLDNDEIDVDGYRAEVTRMARQVKAAVVDPTEAGKLAALNKYLFADRGFHGSRGDYYSRSNSYLSEVIDDREGQPITLAVLYIELARRLDLKVEGVGLPGHFLVRYTPTKGDPEFLDVFEGAKPVSKADALGMAAAALGAPVDDAVLAATTKRAVIVRILHNLLNAAQQEQDPAGALRYLDAILAVDGDAVQERGLRALMRARSGDRDGALEDVDWLLEKKPEGVDLDRLKEFRQKLQLGTL